MHMQKEIREIAVQYGNFIKLIHFNEPLRASTMSKICQSLLILEASHL